MQNRYIKSGTISSGITYYIYEDTDGSIFAETLCNRHCVIAKDIEEFYQIPISKLESMIYSAEMSIAK